MEGDVSPNHSCTLHTTKPIAAAVMYGVVSTCVSVQAIHSTGSDVDCYRWIGLFIDCSCHRDRESNNVSSNAGAVTANNVHKGTPYTKSPITMLSVAFVRLPCFTQTGGSRDMMG